MSKSELDPNWMKREIDKMVSDLIEKWKEKGQKKVREAIKKLKGD